MGSCSHEHLFMRVRRRVFFVDARCSPSLCARLRRQGRSGDGGGGGGECTDAVDAPIEWVDFVLLSARADISSPRIQTGRREGEPYCAFLVCLQ